MAATPPKPQTSTTLTTSTIPTTTIQSSTINNIVNVNNNNNKQNNNNNLNCNCTNISIMQLFHEMKQEFPTVPDHVVSQCVLDNCHNRPNCIDNLRKEALIQPIIQSYPSQILMRNNNNKRCIDNNNIIILTTQKNDDDIDITAQPITTASTTTTKNINNNNNNDLSDNYNNINNMKQSDMQQTNTNNNNNNNTNNNNNNNNSDNNNIINNRPQRPNTLNFSKEPYNPVAAFVRSGYRPTRSAPPPPSQSSSSLSSILSQQQQIHPFQQQQQISPSDVTTNNDSINVSLNVTVSPVSGRPPVRPPRHTTALNVQPESPFSRDRLLDSPRSYTSVNFTLRQPCVSPQSPIEITAGPGLTYSSSSFDARQGYQSRLQITVGGSGGVGGNSSGSTISAMRTRPLSRNNNNINNYNNNNNSITMSDDDDFGININSGQLRALSISNENLETSCYTPPHQNSEAEIVHRQLIHKNNLLGELEKDKRQLEIMQKEVRDLHAPLPPDGTSQLKDDIEQLRSDCDRMSVEVQEAGPYLLGETNEAFYQNIYSGQRLTVQTRPPRPPRPPLPIALRTNSQQLQQQQNINNNLVSSGNNINNHNNNNTATTSNNISNNNNTQNTNIINQEEQQQHWICNMCTFRNHPLLNKCEQCEMPQISSGTVINSQLLFSPRLHNMRFLNKAPPIPLPLPTTTTATSMAIGSSKSSTNIITTNNNNYHIPIHYQNGGNITIPSLPNTRNLYDNNNSSNTNTTTTQTTNSKIFSGLSRLT